MVSRRCAALFLSSVGAMCLLYTAACQPKTGDRSDRSVREAATAHPEMPQADVTALTPELSVEELCRPFEVPVNMEFFTPGHPGNYPKNIKCTLILEAPEKKVVRLDFRDKFELEPSQDCKNDYLEVRDGAHGYNDLMKPRFCGSEFPDVITSTDRHLWLHFRSDESIESEGFKAVYEFIDRSEDTPEAKVCSFEVGGKVGLIKKSDIKNDTVTFNAENKYPTDCKWRIEVKEGWKIQLSFEKFGLAKPNECESNFLEIFSDNTDIPSREKKFCGSIADTVTSKGTVMYVRFFADHTAMEKSHFQMLYTAYRETDKCEADEYDCEDQKCIALDLKCDGHFNCHFRWDEEQCKTEPLPLSEYHIIIIMVIFTLILSGMCFTFVFNCVKKLIRDHRTIQEYIRESREQQLNELGKQEAEKAKNKLGRSRSNSTHSSESHRFAPNTLTNTPCYVPGGELLPILIRTDHNINGDAYNQSIHHYETEAPPPEMCDSACQTRESLFATNYNSEHSTPNHSVTSANSKPSPPAPFSTFGYKKETKFRAEAKIEMEKVDQVEKRRPYSVQTTKSAPDVIVTH